MTPPLTPTAPPNAVGARSPAEELRHCCYSLIGSLDAICSRLPECPEARVLRYQIEGGMPAMTALADQVTGLSTPPAQAYDRGYQVGVLMIREEREGERLPRDAWHQPPGEFMRELQAAAG